MHKHHSPPGSSSAFYTSSAEDVPTASSILGARTALVAHEASSTHFAPCCPAHPILLQSIISLTAIRIVLERKSLPYLNRLMFSEQSTAFMPSHKVPWNTACWP